MNEVTHQPLVSVVICTYNQEGFIRETLDSVVGQTYPNLEIIVSDDGSADDTPRIVAEYAARYPGRVIAVLSQVNTGIPANINRGLARRTGEYTSWLDGDDVMLPTKIEKQVAFLQQHPEATGCYHDSDVFDSASGKTLGKMSELYNGTSRLLQGRLNDWMRPRNYFIPSSIMARTAACPAHGFDERLVQLSEGLFFVETFRTGILLAINEPLARYRRHDSNITGSAVARDRSAEYELMVYAILEARYPELHRILKRQRTACLLTDAVKFYREGDRARSRRIIWNCIQDGAVVKGVLVLIGLLILRRQTGGLTMGQPYQRPSWINRLAGLVLG